MKTYLRTIIVAFSVGGFLAGSGGVAAAFDEPKIVDYSRLPIFSAETTPPNILVILDNSGSMNFPAYGRPTNNLDIRPDSFPTDGGFYQPLAVYEVTKTYLPDRPEDDAEEFTKSTDVEVYRPVISLGRTRTDRGEVGKVKENATIAAFRFEDLNLDADMEIISAHIEFEAAYTAGTNWDLPLELRITGESAVSPQTFAESDGHISKRATTTHNTIWTQYVASEPWTPGSIHKTAAITKIVQELLGDPEWVPGTKSAGVDNAMVFTFAYEGSDGFDTASARRAVVSYEGHLANPTLDPPKLVISYKAQDGTAYYGYFNSEWLYTSDTNSFSHKYKKVAFIDPLNDEYVNLRLKSGCTDGEWWVRYPADYSLVNQPDEETWPAICLEGADYDTEDLYDGNWMNWATMRRVDIARKVLTGGKGVGVGGGQSDFTGENTAQSSREWTIRYNSGDHDAANPGFHLATPDIALAGSIQDSGVDTGYYDYEIVQQGGVGSPGGFKDPRGTHDLVVDQLRQFDPESFSYDEDTKDYDLGGGILQEFWDEAYWGLEFFETGTGKNLSGGDIVIDLATHPTDADFYNQVNNQKADTWTPLAEALYVAMQYVKQEDVAGSLDYQNGAASVNPVSDPFKRKNTFVECIKTFVLLVTDGASTKDSMIPDALKDTDGDLDTSVSPSIDNKDCDEDDYTNCDYPSGGTNYLDDIALVAHTTDLRPGTDLPGVQNLDLYTVFAAFGADVDSPDYKNARSLLRDAAINGAFEDLDNDGKPSSTAEWDKDGDGEPDGYFQASDGADLKVKLKRAISTILAKSASGTAVSVLSTSAEGEGTLVQAFFKPTLTGDDGIEIKWAGYLQALWVDSYGNIREDTDGDLALDPALDNVITFSIEGGDTKVNRFDVVTLGKPYPVTSGESPDKFETAGIDTVTPIWEAGIRLALTEPDNRRIFTNFDGMTPDLFGGVNFHNNDAVAMGANNTPELKPYFGVRDPKWDYLGDTPDDRAINLISYIRGEDALGNLAAVRNRSLGINGVSEVWKLGDIIYSTPITIQAPPDNYDLIYADRSYAAYKKKYKVSVKADAGSPSGYYLDGWETMVYVGANDGMLHAFTGWKFYDKEFYQPTTTHDVNEDLVDDFTVTGSTLPGEDIGQEVWAFIPQALLPHLKFLADPGYIHTYYVDLKPKIFDAKVFPNQEAVGGPHIGSPGDSKGWGTILVGGLRLGGKKIDLYEDFGSGLVDKTIAASYFAIDITEPRNPVLLWEKSFDEIGLTMSDPAVIRVGDHSEADPLLPSNPGKWWVLFGSGPEANDVTDSTDKTDQTSQGSYEGVSVQPGHIYVLDVLTGEPVSGGPGPDGIVGNDDDLDYLFATPNEDHAFMAGAASIDKFLNFNVDAIYIGSTDDVNDGTGNPDWQGKMYKITVPWVCTYADCSATKRYYGVAGRGYFQDDPTQWTLSELFDSPGPITAPPSLSIDNLANTWVYFGTGRYLNKDDETDTSLQHLFGIKDPFFNRVAVMATAPPACCAAPATCSDADLLNCGQNTYAADYYEKYGAVPSLVLDKDRLFDGDSYKIFYPWTAESSLDGTDPAVVDCESGKNLLFEIGDLHGDDTCIAYRMECFDMVEDGCATVRDDFTGGEEGDVYLNAGNLAKAGDCYCKQKITPHPEWGVQSAPAADCSAFVSGEMGDILGDGTCIGMIWSCASATETSCEVGGVPIAFGTVGAGMGDDGTCECESSYYPIDPDSELIKSQDFPPYIYYYRRPEGNCYDVAAPVIGDTPNYALSFAGTGTDVLDASSNKIYEVDGDGNIIYVLDADGNRIETGGYCLSSWWTCKEDGVGMTGDCAKYYSDGTTLAADIDFHKQDIKPADLSASDTDGACICSYSDEPVAHVKQTGVLTGDAFDPVTKEPMTFEKVVAKARLEDGWYRELSGARERGITKPGLIGGISLFTTYIPSEEDCAFGGESWLYALYYETGTAYEEVVIGFETDIWGDLVAKDRLKLGTGLASSVGLHIGLQDENSATGFIQQSTGAITKLRIDPAFQIRSGLTSWRDN